MLELVFAQKKKPARVVNLTIGKWKEKIKQQKTEKTRQVKNTI